MTATVLARRKALGLTRYELAMRARCSVTYLQIIEAGVVPELSRVMPRIESVLAELESQDEGQSA